MVVRLVKMSLKEENIPVFLANFTSYCDQIRSFNGCHLLELFQDTNDPKIFFTHSYWESEELLDVYRRSNLFKTVWSQTKPLFNKKPQAWSVDKIVSLP